MSKASSLKKLTAPIEVLARNFSKSRWLPREFLSRSCPTGCVCLVGTPEEILLGFWLLRCWSSCFWCIGAGEQEPLERLGVTALLQQFAKMGMGLSCLACTACSAACTTLSAVCSCAGCLCGGSSAKDTPTDLMVGKLRSLALIITSLVVGLLTQYFWAKHAADHLDAWASNCGNNETCIGNSAIYR
jgi:hypothetical protein